MLDTLKRTTWLAASLALASALGGCQPGEADGSRASESELASTNGLAMINGLTLINGLSGNGLSGNGLSGNGLSGNGLSGNGLLMDPLSTTNLASSSYLMNSADGRSTVTYMVRCALPANHTITKKDSGGASYSFAGSIGVAPEWETGTCGTACQERVSACLLAHVNTSGQHIAIWLDSEGAIGWGQSTDFPYQEGSFFGNVFVSPPVADFCNGKDFDSATVPGRLGAGQANAPYKNPFYTGAPCQNNCTAHSTDGFSQCSTYTHVVTVWRNFDPNTQYKICNKGNALCLSVSGSSTANSAAIIQSPYAATANQKWVITQISAKKYKVINVNSGKALDITGARTTDGTPAIQYSYSGSANQLWSFTSLADQAGNYVIAPTMNTAASLSPPSIGSMSSGTAIQEWTYNTGDYMKWSILPG